MSDCDAQADTWDDGFITCDRPAGHAGLHYDELQDVSWKKGKPDE